MTISIGTTTLRRNEVDFLGTLPEVLDNLRSQFVTSKLQRTPATPFNNKVATRALNHILAKRPSYGSRHKKNAPEGVSGVVEVGGVEPPSKTCRLAALPQAWSALGASWWGADEPLRTLAPLDLGLPRRAPRKAQPVPPSGRPKPPVGRFYESATW